MEILEVIPSGGNKGSGESAHIHMRRLTRAFPAGITQTLDVDEDSDQKLDLARYIKMGVYFHIWR